MHKITKEMLPNLPDEIFNMFIAQINATELSPFDSEPGGRWFYHLGNLSVEAFNQLRWIRTVITFKEALFHPNSREEVDALIHYCELEGKAIARALYPWHPADSPSRLKGIKKIIINTGRLPAPIVAIRTGDGLRVLDGCHRLSAAVSCPNPDEIPLDAWIGEFPENM